ncbi:hypothetical protein [Pseudomonas fulva]|uniref:hypothetical protein n=1 Tax=Pseudomonas fulva TaxID=47880 RepID=UPI000672374C|nr:hypothetical protein [Pseudomonas fulva]
MVSALYFVLMWWAVGERIGALKTMELNSVGDFLAGAFSPLAFLWLVLGFAQQGLELRISSDTLKLQVKELNESVAQQKELAIATKETLKNQELSFDPVLQLKFTGLSEALDEGDQHEVCGFEIHNVGATCEHVNAKIIDDYGLVLKEYNFPLVARDGTVGFSVWDSMGECERAELVVTYRKANGLSGVQVFLLVPTPYREPGEWFVSINKKIPEA